MTFGQNLFDIIGILIGFIAVMFLLSLLVTALVQATQAAFRLRARNLKKGIISLLDSVPGVTRDKNKKAADILKTQDFRAVSRVKEPNKLISWLKGSPVSYLDPKELLRALDDSKVRLNEEKVDQLKSKFDELWTKIERQMEKRFLFLIRLITIVWAIALAFYFQVSTPDLLNRLSIDPGLRARYAEEAAKLLDEKKAGLNVVKDYRDVSQEALSQLAKQYPELKDKIEKVTSSGKNKDELWAELDKALSDGVPDKAKILKSYEEIWDGHHKEIKEENLEQARAAIDRLGRFNINAWQYGIEFYYKERALQLKNIVGILFTAVLLTLGAPFWFDRLKDVVKLKDVLSKGIKPENKK